MKYVRGTCTNLKITRHAVTLKVTTCERNLGQDHALKYMLWLMYRINIPNIDDLT